MTRTKRRQPYTVGALVEVLSGHSKGLWVRVYDIKSNLVLVRMWLPEVPQDRVPFWISTHKVAWANSDEVASFVAKNLRQGIALQARLEKLG